MAIVVKSMAVSGVDGFMVEIEASAIRGQQQMMSIIGLPDQAIKEAGERIQAAIISCGYDIPKDKVIISLAPGDRKKRGSHFDLGMIIALLYQTDQISPKNLGEYLSGTIGAAFTGLSIPEISGAQLAMAGAGSGGVANNRTINMGGLSVVVNGYESKNDNDLADTIVHRINDMLNEDGSVWGK